MSFASRWCADDSSVSYQGLVDTVLFHIDALTGEDSTYASPTDSLLQGFDIIAGSLVETYLVRDGPHKYVILFDEFMQVCI